MSIATEITRIQQAKADIKTAIEVKGVTVPSSATIDTYATYVSQISGGGGGGDTTTLEKLIDRSITSIDIPSGVTSIGSNAFRGCSGLTTCTIGSGVTSIGDYAFYDCSSLTSIDIPNSVTSIGNSAFFRCSGLTTVTIGSGVTSVGRQAFNGCISLTSLTVNATTPPTLGMNALAGTSNDLKIYVPASSVETYKSASGWSNYSSRIQAIPNS